MGILRLLHENTWLFWTAAGLFIVHWLGELYYVQHASPFADTTARRRKWELFVFLLPPVAVIWFSVRQITGWRRPADEEVEAEGWTPPVGLMDWLKQWRLLVAMVATEMAGGLVGRAASPHYSEFSRNWLGGALAAPIGFALGLLWQYWSPERRQSIPVYPAVFLGVIATVLGASALFIELPEMQREMELIRSLRRVQASEIRRIEFFDRYGEKRLGTVDTPSAIARFAAACRDVEGHTPVSPSYAAEWYVRLVGTEPDELLCRFDRSDPCEVVGNFVTKRGRAIFYHGRFRSRQMRRWFEEHAPRGGD